MPLGRKQSARNADFAETWANIGSIISRMDVIAALDQAASEIRQRVAGYRRVGVAWSGGKDSLALALAASWAGVDLRGPLCVVRQLEFPAYLTWCDAHKPPGIEYVSNDTLDLAWLRDHPQYLFPADAQHGFFWTRAGTLAGQARYYERNRLDLLLFGRRYADGNVIGPNGIHENKAGIRQYCPIRSWSHELVLGAIHYHQLSMPPTYSWANGWTSGTGPWPGRQHMGSVDEGWRQTYVIDPYVVENAARVIPSAAQFLRRTLGMASSA